MRCPRCRTASWPTSAEPVGDRTRLRPGALDHAVAHAVPVAPCVSMTASRGPVLRVPRPAAQRGHVPRQGVEQAQCLPVAEPAVHRPPARAMVRRPEGATRARPRLRGRLFTFLDHPGMPPTTIAANANCARPRHTARSTGGFRSDWGADLSAAVRSLIGTAQRRGIDAYQVIRDTLRGQSALQPG